MKVLRNTLEAVVETWDDPGDYPNGLAAGPLPSYDYLAGLEGELELKLNKKEWLELQRLLSHEGVPDPGGVAPVVLCLPQEYLQELANDYLPKGIVSVSKWDFSLKVNNHITLWDAGEGVEGDLSEEPEPDYDMIREAKEGW